MPKATYVTIPEEVVKDNIAPNTAVRQKRKIAWSAIGFKLRDMLEGLFYRDNLPLYVLAFLLGRVAIMGEIAPFGLAFFAAVAQTARDKALGTAVWSICGALTAGLYGEAASYIFAVVLYFRWARSLSRWHTKIMAIPLLMFCAVITLGLVKMLFGQVNLYNGLVVLLDAALCMILAYIFMFGVPIIAAHFDKDKAEVNVGNESLICLIAILALAVAGLGNVSVYGYGLRNIVGGVLIMMLALTGGSGLGASVGIAVGLVVGLTNGNTPLMVAMYALAGVSAGVFKELGKFAVILGFVLGGAIISIYFGYNSQLIVGLSEAAISSALFLLIPVKRLKTWQNKLSNNDPAISNAVVLHEASEKLSNISSMFRELSEAFGIINADTRQKFREQELSKMISLAGERVCAACSRRSVCWERDFYRTYQAMLDMFSRAEKGGLKADITAGVIEENCIKKTELVKAISYVAEQNRELLYWQKKLADYRQLVSEQLQATGTIIGNLSQEVVREQHSDKELAQIIRQKCGLIDCSLDSLRVIRSRGVATVEAHKKPCNGNRECMNTILPMVANIMQEKMVLHAECGNKAKNKKCRLTIEVADRYQIKTGIASVPKANQRVCGDVCRVVPLNKGKVALMLSDGMGSGASAAGESSMAIRFLEKLLSVGFDVNVAVKIANSLLLLRTPDESFATIDMAIIDTYSGETEFLKIGSAPSFIKRVGEVTNINSSSVPIGILQQIEIEPIKFSAVAGDYIIMVSDGIADLPNASAKESWLVNYLRLIHEVEPQELADKILHQAIKLSGGKARDDMTVLVSRLVERPAMAQ